MGKPGLTQRSTRKADITTLSTSQGELGAGRPLETGCSEDRAPTRRLVAPPPSLLPPPHLLVPAPAVLFHLILQDGFLALWTEDQEQQTVGLMEGQVARGHTSFAAGSRGRKNRLISWYKAGSRISYPGLLD